MIFEEVNRIKRSGATGSAIAPVKKAMSVIGITAIKELAEADRFELMRFEAILPRIVLPNDISIASSRVKVSPHER